MKLVVYLLLFFVGAAAILGVRYLQVKNLPKYAAQQLTGKLEPPTGALRGIFNGTEGEVKHLLRENDDYQTATPGGGIRQGEAVTTDLDSSADITFGSDYTLSLGAGTDVSFANLVPPNVLILQRSGTVDYQAELDKPPVSVRARSALVEILPGSAIVSVEGRTVIVYVFSGSAKIGIVDLENNTHVYDVPAEHRAVVDDSTRVVRIE